MAEETVEEILKKEGVIKEPPKEETVVIEEKIDLKKVLMNLEKVSAEVNALKEIKFQADERIREISEKIGELRSLIFQKENTIKEMELKVKMLDEFVSDIRPQKIRKEMDERRDEIEKVDLKIEKVEAINKDTLRALEGIQKIVENIKSVEKLQEMVKSVEENVLNAKKTKFEVDRLAGKTESFYIEMENRIKDFTEFKAKLERLDELTTEIMKSSDEVKIKLSGFVLKEDLDNFKKNIDGIVVSNKEKTESKIKSIEDVLKIPEEEFRKKLLYLNKRKDDVSKLLMNLEEQYRKAMITEKTYLEVKEKNQNLMKQVEEEIKKLEGQEKITFRSLPSIISDLERGIITVDAKEGSLEESLNQQKKYIEETINKTNEVIEKVKAIDIDEIKKRIELTESEMKGIKKSDITEVLSSQTELTKNILKKFKDTEEKITKISNSLDSFDLKIRFFEILSILSRVENLGEVSSYISEFDSIISSMKSKDVWSEEKQTLTIELLNEISESNRTRGYIDVKRIFDDEIEKIKVHEVYKNF